MDFLNEREMFPDYGSRPGVSETVAHGMIWWLCGKVILYLTALVFIAKASHSLQKRKI